MNLLMVGQLVSQHAGSSEHKISGRRSEQEIVSYMFKWIWWGMIVLGLGLVLLVTAKSLMNMNVLDWKLVSLLRLVSTYVILGGVGMSAFGVFNAVRQGASLSPGRSPNELTEPVNTNELPTNPVPASLPSVTERTTQLIAVDAVRKSSAELK